MVGRDWLVQAKELEEIISRAGLDHHQFTAHLSNPVSLCSYVRIAEEIAGLVPAAARILDWGCGHGQMTYLLRKRGLDVVSYDLEEQRNLKNTPFLVGIPVVYSKEPVLIEFGDMQFDAVLSCGVLEHVPEPEGSLREINRILKEQGLLFIYMLPNRYAYTEWINERRGIQGHPVRYSMAAVRRLLAASGFAMVKKGRGNIFPKNLTGFPPLIKRVYGRLAQFLVPIDYFLAGVPLLNLFSGVLEVVARKERGLN